MKPITKKRFKAYLIDTAIATAITAGVECVLRKRIKNEAFHALVTPTLVMWTLEYTQLKRTGQTIGYKQQGLLLETENGQKPETEQIIKRMAYRDSIGGFKYLGNPKGFDEGEGETMPHDRYAQTKVSEL